MQERRDQPNDRKIERGLKKNCLKHLIATAFICCITLASFSQEDSTAFAKLLTEFNGVFISAKTETGATFFDQLYNATNWVLNVQNPTFRSARKEFGKVLNLDGDSLLAKMAYTVYNNLPAEVFWKDQQVDLIRFQKLFAIANEKLCPCVTDRIKTDTKKTMIWTLVSQCDTLLHQDTAYKIRIQAETQRFALSDLARAQKSIVKYLYANCSAFKMAVNDILITITIDNYFSFGRDHGQTIEDDISRFYQKKPDSLNIIFPDHSSYESDIKQSSSLIASKAEWMGSVRREPGTRQFIQSRTYYKEGKPTVLLGQTICYYEQEDTWFSVKGLRFITPDRIENKEELLKGINIQPPPPHPPELRVQPGKKTVKKN
jgi:hypothetical protein